MKNFTSIKIAMLAKPFILFALFITITASANSQAFITNWITPNTSITIPTIGTGYKYDIRWANISHPGQAEGSASGINGNFTILDITPGDTYQIAIEGSFPRIYINEGDEANNIISVVQWGSIAWQSMEDAFSGCTILNINSSDKPNLSNVTSMRRMFYNCKNLNGNIESWDVSNIKDMSSLFEGNNTFNSPIGIWNTQNVTNMSSMFKDATIFNQPLNDWSTKNVVDMSNMFYNVYNFNQPIGGWITENVTNLSGMFVGAHHFNQPLNDWNTANVKNMSNMFAVATSFNQPLDKWNTGNVTDMSEMFTMARVFNQDIGMWNTSQVTNMQRMFSSAVLFNYSINEWNTSSVTNMNEMFTNATTFNQPLDKWNTGNVTDMASMFSNAYSFNLPIGNWNTDFVNNMAYMFADATAFDQPIGDWNTSNVANMIGMFLYATSFNQTLEKWNTAGVTDMSRMFENATAYNQYNESWDTKAVMDMSRMFKNAKSFNQSIGKWNISNVTTMYEMLDFSALSVDNYDNTLINWAAQTVMPDVPLGATALKYCAGDAARTTLMSAPNNWVITGDIFECSAPLPIILVNFTGQRQNENTVLLHWQTATEINNQHFEIEISNDGANFKKAGTVAGAGNSNANKNYTFTINNSTANYYRLKQVDNNGAFKYSNIVFVKESGNKAISIYPNPSNGNFEINVNTSAKQNAVIIYNTEGVQVWKGTISGTPQNIKTNLPKGFYFLHVTVNGQTKVQKLIIE